MTEYFAENLDFADIFEQIDRLWTGSCLYGGYVYETIELFIRLTIGNFCG